MASLIHHQAPRDQQITPKNQAVSDQAVSDRAVSDRAVSDQAVSNQAVSNQAAPSQPGPQKQIVVQEPVDISNEGFTVLKPGTNPKYE